MLKKGFSLLIALLISFIGFNSLNTVQAATTQSKPVVSKNLASTLKSVKNNKQLILLVKKQRTNGRVLKI